MKLSEISYREYIALEIFSRNPVRDVSTAFKKADDFLWQVGKEDARVQAAEARTAIAEARYSMLLNMPGDVAARIALLGIWEFLGVDNQTSAMQMLRDAFPELGK